MTENSIDSPDHIRISLAAAMSLGLRPGRFYRDARLHCLNLLLTYEDGCHANCSYCGLSRGGAGGFGERSFIRVEWPGYRTDEIIGRAREHRERFERVCVSMIMHPGAFEDAILITRRMNRETGLPVSVLVNPTVMHDGDMETLKESGADMISVAIDAATSELFEMNRGREVNGPHRWESYWQALDDAVLALGRDKVGCHLIAGLGETERQMVEAVQRVRTAGGMSHLFSFYPEAGSRLEKAGPCPPDHFRRIQLARFLIDYDIAGLDDMEFDEHDRIVGFGLKGADLDQLVDSGVPFMTSGCPGRSRICACNRPYGDGPPSDIRSYPFSLESDDILLVRKQLATYREYAGNQVLDVGA